MADTQILVDIVGRETVTPAVGSAVGALGGLTGAVGGVSHAFVGAAEAAAKMAVAVGAIGVGAFAAGMTSAITSAAGFEKQISAIAAVSGATAAQMDGIRTVALQLGKDTSFSASEAAAGMEEMIKAGISLTDAMNGAARAGLDLAAASGTDVPEAATIMSNAMNVFKISGENASHVADLLTQASNASATSVHELGYSLASGGAAAAAAGISLEDFTTTMALMAAHGIKGADSGTSFKSMVMQLTPTSKAAATEMRKLGLITADGANQFFDASGKAKGMSDIAGILAKSMAGLSKEQQIVALKTMFGTDAFRIAQVLMEENTEGFNAMTAAEAASGTAHDSSATRLDNLAGSMEKLKGSLETVSIMFGTPFLAPLKRVADALTDVVNRSEPFITALGTRMAAGLDAFVTKAMAAGPAILAMGRGFLDFGRYIGAVLTDGDTLNDWLTHIPAGFQGLAAAAGAGVAALRNLALGLKGIILGMGGTGGVTGLVETLTGAFQTLLPIAQAVGKAFVDNITTTFRFLATSVIPPVVSMVQQVGHLLIGTLLPAAQQTGNVMRGIFGATLAWLAETVFPPLLSIVKQTVDFWTGVMLPTLPAIAATLRTTLGATIEWLATDIWPMLTTAATVAWQFISGTIVPQIPAAAALLRSVLGAALEWIGNTGWPLLVAGAQIAWTFLQTKVIPVVMDVVTWLKVNLPAAIATVVTAFQAIQGKVQPIIEAVFSGDIKAAIQNLGAAFSAFATLAMGWLKEQVAKIDWAAVWAAATTIATDLATYVMGLTIDWLTWLKAQVAAIPWADVWASAVTIATDLGTYLLGLVIDFATWLKAQVAAIDWAAVWTSATTIATALGTYLLGLVIDFATWLKQEVAKIPWPDVWTAATTAATALGTYLMGLAVDFATWLGAEVAKIPWPTVWANVKLTAQQIVDALAAAATGFDMALATWLQHVIESTDWKAVGDALGRSLVQPFTEGTQTAVDGIGAGLKPETLRKAIFDFFSGIITGVFAELAPIFQKAFDDAIRKITPKRPDWLPAGVPWPFGPQAGSGQEFPSSPGATTPAPRQGTTAPEPKPVTRASSKEEKIARAKEWAIAQGLQDPDLFAAQLMQESSFDNDAFAPNNAGGARGIGQFIPSTGSTIAARLGTTYEEMVKDPELSIQGAAMHMRELQDQFGTQQRALGAYYAGPNGGPQPGYVQAVQGRLPQVAGIGPRQGTTGQDAGAMTGPVQLRHKGTGAVSTVDASMLQDMTNLDEFDIIGQQGAAAAGSKTKLNGSMGIDATQFAIGNQFEMGLPWAQAAAACGPAAAAIFYQATGRTPNPQEVMQIARANGWSQGAGMGGPGNFMGMLGDMGINAALDMTPTEAELQASVMAGNPTAISTGGGNVPLSSGHYFVAQGFNAETGQYDLGETGGGPGGALQGGSRFMTLDEITALAGPMNAIITLTDTAAQSFQKMSQDVQTVGTAAAAGAPQLASIGTAIDPVVAAMDQGAVSVGGMTDAIIASASNQGIATESASAYSEGLIGQDAALRAVVASFAETTPAAATLLAQMDAGTISTDDAALAFAGLSTSTAVASGAITTMATDAGLASDVLATEIPADTQVMADEASIDAATMATNVALSAQTMEDQASISGDTLRQELTDSTGLMESDASADALLMKDNVSLAADTMHTDAATAAQDMQTDVTTAADTMHTDSATAVQTLHTDVATAMGAARTDATTAAQGMQTGVTTAAGTMHSAAGGHVKTFASEATSAFGSIKKPAEEAADAMTAVGEVEIPAPDVSDVLDALKKVTREADKASVAVGKIGGTHGGGSGKEGAPGKASGGSVIAGMGYRVGELGPEYFTPNIGGYITPNERLRAGGGDVIDYDRLAAAIARVSGKTYSLTVNTQASHEPIVQDFALLEALSRSGS